MSRKGEKAAAPQPPAVATPETSRQGRQRRQILLATGVIALAALAAYANSFAGVNVYDDGPAITQNPTIRHLWPISRVLSPPAHGETVSGRPFLNLSLALNYAVGQSQVWGYHAMNLAIHIFAALALFGIVRRTLLRLGEPEAGEKGSRGERENSESPFLPFSPAPFLPCSSECLLAFSIALLWVVHPLQTESVTYIVQRAESLAGLFYFLTLYCVIRGAGAGMGQLSILWHAGAVLACLLGVATKEVVVTAPLAVLLYDRMFLAGSFRRALRRRWGLYAGLAASWALLGYLVVATGLMARGTGPDRWSYACTQPGVLLYYLRLCAWPHPLCLDYEWPMSCSLKDVLPPAIVVAGLIAATIYGLIRNRPWGFLGGWFFLVLAPTSSVIPLEQAAFEHRLYLPLAAVLTLAVICGSALGRWLLRRGLVAARTATAIGCCLVLAASVALGCVTRQRNQAYRNEVVLWQDTLDKAPNSWRAHNNLGLALAARGQIDEAIAHFHKALEIMPDDVGAYNNLGLALAARGEADEAIAHYRKALEIKPDHGETYNNLGLVLAGRGQVDEAIAHYRKALEINPDHAEAHINLGIVLAARGQVDEAIAHCRKALEIKPDFAAAHNNLGLALAGRGQADEAIAHYRKALEIKPDYLDAHYNLALVLAGRGQVDEAIAHYRKVLEIKPDYLGARYNLGLVLAGRGQVEEAIVHYRKALQSRPDFAEAHNDLGRALAGQERFDEAIVHFQKAVETKPDYADAHDNLGAALAGRGRIDEAIAHYQKALEIKPDHAEAHYNLAAALAGRGRIDEAIAHYQKALQTRPGWLEANINLGLVLIGQERFEEAIAPFQKAVETKPDYADAHNNLGTALAGRGRIDEAIVQYRKTLEINPDHAEAHNNLGAALAGCGRIDEALAHFRQALALASARNDTALADAIRTRIKLLQPVAPAGKAP